MNIKDGNGNDLNVSIIGYFRVPSLEKQYVMYSIIDDETSEYGHVLIGEVVNIDDGIQILGILDEEKDLVISYYKEISKSVGD